MALTGHLSDLSLSELIEFFCNQRKTGYLKVRYPQGSGYFYLQTGSVVDAKIGTLRGIDAVYYALTLPNAPFEFRAKPEITERTINQPWAQVVLEGLRRLDEGITPSLMGDEALVRLDAFPEGYVEEADPDDDHDQVSDSHSYASSSPAFLSSMPTNSMGKRTPLIAGAVAIAVLGSVAAIGVPAGWYSKSKPTAVSNQPASSANSSNPTTAAAAPSQPNPAVADTKANDAAEAAKRQKERDRADAARKERAANESLKPASAASTPNKAEAAKSAPKVVTVTVTYDESGHVTGATGDATAARIARQKRFPPGKGGTATISIPVNQ
jgi:hypothetical protein